VVTVTNVLFACTVAWLAWLWSRQRRIWVRQDDLLERHVRLLNTLEDIVAVADPHSGHILEANERFLRLLNYERSHVPHLTLSQVCAGLPDSSHLVASGQRLTCESQLRTRQGELIDVGFTLTVIMQAETRLLCLVGSDAERRRRTERQLRDSEARLIHLTAHDPLTGLPNRTALRQRLPKLLEQRRGMPGMLALFYIDLDQFKHVNDSRTHDAGDQLLESMSRQLRAATAPEDLLFRIGGDEFLVVAPAAKDMASVRAAAQQLLNAARAPIRLADATLTITASIGVAVYPRDGQTFDVLLKHADIALYQAKEQGRNCVELFANHMNVALEEHLALEQDLRRAIDTDQIYVEYQPLVELAGGSLVSFEALARWRHPTLGSISPAKFIPVAERSGLVIAIGERILREVVAQLERWREANVPLAPIAINVAAMQLERTEFPTLVHELCMEHDVDPKWLSFELTESVWVRNSNKHIVAIDTLRHGGSLVSIDDFGTGFSNLSYLRDLPVDAVKIDRSFVTNVATDPSDAAIVSGVVAMAKSRQLVVVAEGVETIEQIDKLRELGCHRAQGYYYGKPMSVGLCRALLEQMGTTRRMTETVMVRALKVAQH
jgi:diguanylate cyclase (GGDEF)-like protein